MPDLEISKLPVLAGSALQATDPLPLADLSASETKKVTVKDLLQSGIALIDDLSIPSSKFQLIIPTSGVGTTELADSAVTAAKLAANSSAVLSPTATRAVGAFIGQLHYDNATGLATIWDGGTWQAWKAAGSLNSVTADTTGVIHVKAVQTGDVVALNAEPAPTTAGGEFLAGPPTAGGVVTARAIVPGDLPKASTLAAGVVMVPLGQGLRIDGGASGLDASLEIANDVVASGTAQLVTYDHKGLVTGGRALAGTDLPVATTNTLGTIATGTEFAIGAGNHLRHANSVTAGTGIKVTFDAAGHVTSTAPLVESDIPGLNANKIVSGVFHSDRVADRSITADKLANYALAFIQEVVPTAGVNAHPIGMTWLQESTGQVSVWNGNSWMKTGASTLFNRNLRYGGTYDATTGVITGVTQFGTAEGVKVGDQVPAGDDKIAGLYFVASTTGSSASLAGGAVMDAGDWLLCHGTSSGWVRIDTLSGAGGGGGGASYLDDLLDVVITAPKSGDTLRFATNGQWVNLPASDPSLQATTTVPGIVELATEAEAEAGTDAVRAVTPAGLKAAIIKTSGGASATAPTSPGLGQTWTDTSKSPPVVNVWDGTKWVAVGAAPPDASTTVKGIVQLADGAAVLAGTAGRVVTADQLKATNDAIATAAGSGITAINATAPVTVTGTGNTRTVAVGDASTTTKGVVQLADATAITAGTAGRVVDAAQLKAITPGPVISGGITAVAALAIDCSLGNYFTKTVAADSAFTFSGAPAARSYAFTLKVIHTSGAITWPTSVKWPGGTAPAPTAGKTHLFMFHTDDGGTSWCGSCLLNYTT